MAKANSILDAAGFTSGDVAGDVECGDAAFDLNERRGNLLLDSDAGVTHGLSLGFDDGVDPHGL